MGQIHHANSSAGNYRWPGGKRVAVYVTAMLEVWSEGKAPTYTVQTTALQKGAVDYGGIAWSRYGGNVGAWRIVRTLNEFGIRGTFATNAMVTKIYPELIAEIVRSGHDIAGHGIWQDQMINEMSPEEQRKAIKQTLDMFEEATGKRPEGWLSQVLAWTPETPGFLAMEGVRWWGDAKDIDLPKKVKTAHGNIIAVPVSEFTDNRVLRGSPRNFRDIYTDTFDYLYRHEPMSVLNIILHCQWGGRPPIISVFRQIMEHISRFPDVWLTTPGELAGWFSAQDLNEVTYAERYFSNGMSTR